jgi:gas vesicle protein
MKKSKVLVLIVLAFGLAFNSCREDKKTPEDKIEAAIDDVKTEVKENSEELSDDVQDALEDVEDEIKEAKEEAKKVKIDE